MDLNIRACARKLVAETFQIFSSAVRNRKSECRISSMLVMSARPYCRTIQLFLRCTLIRFLTTCRVNVQLSSRSMELRDNSSVMKLGPVFSLNRRMLIHLRQLFVDWRMIPKVEGKWGAGGENGY